MSDDRLIAEFITVGHTTFSPGIRLQTVLDRIERGFTYRDDGLLRVKPEGCKCPVDGWDGKWRPICKDYAEHSMFGDCAVCEHDIECHQQPPTSGTKP